MLGVEKHRTKINGNIHGLFCFVRSLPTIKQFFDLTKKIFKTISISRSLKIQIALSAKKSYQVQLFIHVEIWKSLMMEQIKFSRYNIYMNVFWRSIRKKDHDPRAHANLKNSIIIVMKTKHSNSRKIILNLVACLLTFYSIFISFIIQGNRQFKHFVLCYTLQ